VFFVSFSFDFFSDLSRWDTVLQKVTPSWKQVLPVFWMHGRE
jgi:hypothetical protein